MSCDCIAFLWGGISRARQREIIADEHTQSNAPEQRYQSPLRRSGTYPSLVRRSRYVLSTGRSSDLVSSHPFTFSACRASQPFGFPALSVVALWSTPSSQWFCSMGAPLHSSGPVGESHSVPYSPCASGICRRQGTCKYPVILFFMWYYSIFAVMLQEGNLIACD